MEKQKLELDQETASGLAYGDFDNSIYEVVSNINGHSRWTINFELVIKTLVDGRFWKARYSKGATESQDEGPFEYVSSTFTEVFPIKKEVIVYI